ncbi:MAG TPA: BON domain-containing protein [Albitalea sp.]|uniref:BON domain-containing protein n=1 Tax=Piscinibacter sp. TaxID=1903157 RepID=UPI002ED1954D
MIRRLAASMALLLAACGTAPAETEPLLLNPFHDPFEQATVATPCPAPRGPAYTEAQRNQEAHYRVERGTSCWLAGQCSEPNAYRYDERIAQAAVGALRADAALAGSAIWVIAERRFVYLQGCVGDAAQAARAEAVVKAVADVQLVIPALSLPGEKPRYPTARP